MIFPWPPSVLSPNARVHWATKAKAAKAYKHVCWALAREANVYVAWDGPVNVWMTFVMPDKRRRDMDNMLASCKALLDGLAIALGVDDSRFRLHLSIGKPDAIGGRVIVRVTRQDGAE